MNFGLARQLKFEAARQEALQKHHYYSFLKMRQEQTKMTREEARKRINTIDTGISNNEINKIFDVLKALGLIKFDEPKKSLTDVICEARCDTMGSSIDQSCFIKCLNDNGYEIVKKY